MQRARWGCCSIARLCLLLLAAGCCSAVAGQDTGWDKLPSTVSSLPACPHGCVAGEQALGFLYSALFDASLDEVHVFADLRYAASWNDAGEHMLDACWFSTRRDGVGFTTPARTTRMFDNPVFMTGFRVVCASPQLSFALAHDEPLLAGFSLHGRHWAPRIPVTRVALEQRAPVGACIGTLYKGMDKQPQVREWARHMHGLGVHDFHAYVSAGDIKFRAEDLLAWWRPEAFVPGQRIPGWEWVHTPTFPYELRWVRGQLTHYQHCMFLHRHAYQYILFLDTDEFPILRLQAGRLPALLEQAAQQWPAASSFSFHRYAYRGGCRPSTQAQISTNLTRRDWHEQFDAREVQPESRRDIVERGWGHIMLDKGLVMGDKLAARPLAVDDLYLHWMRTARAGFTAKVHTLPTLVVYIKHIRKHSDSCEGLVFEDPPAQVTIKSLQLEQQRQG